MNLKPTLCQKICKSLILVLLIIVWTAPVVTAASVTLRWDPNVPSPEGYRVFVRKSGQAYNYNRPDWQGSISTCTFDHLENWTEYFFVVRAYQGDLESIDSAEVHYLPPGYTNGHPMTDDDDDGLPDEWEVHFGLDPLRNDADGDLDRDGISNRDEFRAGLEPDERGVGTAPRRPKPLSPKSNSHTDLNVLLDAGGYSDIDGDAHIATQWQVYDTQSKDCMMDVVTDRRLNQLKVPLMLLDGERTYQWRVRFLDSGGRVSAWSATAYFITQAAENDLDENAISDDRESDPIEAAITRCVSSLSAGCTPTHLVVASEDTVREINQVTLLDPFDLEIDETAPDRLPGSMVAYKLMLHRPGQRALVTIHLSDPAPAGATWIKYDAVNGWQDYSHHAAISVDRLSVTVEVKDGGYGDADGVANGVILDPAGLSLTADSTSVVTAGSSGGGGGGCFIATIQNGSDLGRGPLQNLYLKMRRFLTIINQSPPGNQQDSMLH
jgi:chitinase